MHKPIDMVGKRFGRLEVIKYSHNDKFSHKVWLCRCDCGHYIETSTSDLRSGRMNSCGCYKKDYLHEEKTTHGHTKTSLYRIFHHMKMRCYEKSDQDFACYGGRGIKICDEWLNNFEEFYQWSNKNGYKKGLTIDRIDVNGNYEPCNCRWVSRMVQSNNKRNNLFVTYLGETHTLAEWARKFDIKYMRLYKKYQKGLRGEELFNDLKKDS